MSADFARPEFLGDTIFVTGRATFFEQDPAPAIAPLNGYPAVHAPSYAPTAGTYERWYAGNMQPLADAAANGTVPTCTPSTCTWSTLR
jgi:hypothetical protein